MKQTDAIKRMFSLCQYRCFKASTSRGNCHGSLFSLLCCSAACFVLICSLKPYRFGTHNYVSPGTISNDWRVISLSTSSSNLKQRMCSQLQLRQSGTRKHAVSQQDKIVRLKKVPRLILVVVESMHRLMMTMTMTTSSRQQKKGPEGNFRIVETLSGLIDHFATKASRKRLHAPTTPPGLC